MIYVVEDDAGVRDLELYALRQAGYNAVGFAEPSSFLAALEQQLPKAVLLDVMLPGSDGITLLRGMRQNARTSRVPVILVIARDAEMDKVRGLDEGADDYLTKPFGVMELLARVRALLRRANDEERSSLLHLGAVPLDRSCHRVTEDGREVVLTHMEFELLAYLLSHAGKVVTREKLLDSVWGIAYAGDTRTVDVHIRTLRQKLGECGSLNATVRGVGYRMEAPNA